MGGCGGGGGAAEAGRADARARRRRGRSLLPRDSCGRQRGVEEEMVRRVGARGRAADAG
jgi:hypothetical protein